MACWLIDFGVGGSVEERVGPLALMAFEEGDDFVGSLAWFELAVCEFVGLADAVQGIFDRLYGLGGDGDWEDAVGRKYVDDCAHGVGDMCLFLVCGREEAGVGPWDLPHKYVGRFCGGGPVGAFLTRDVVLGASEVGVEVDGSHVV